MQKQKFKAAFNLFQLMNFGIKQKLKTSPIRKGEKDLVRETEISKERNPRRFPAACKMRKDKKACGREN